jgi:ABC-type multidrug transport system fused ATPase/permease subunit
MTFNIVKAPITSTTLYAADVAYKIKGKKGYFLSVPKVYQDGKALTVGKGKDLEAFNKNDVTYTYDDAVEPVFSHLSFDFRPGTCTAILGETGAGKTTLIRLILALLHPKEGRVEIYAEGKEHEVSPLYRCNFVYVPQGNTLLSGTIRENLLIGRPDATDEELWDALHLVCADFVSNMPQGLDTVCSESGGGLSEGQAQRLSIARALLRNRSIMLFDEATSALDPETERQLLQNVLSDRRKTVIFITHRPAVIDYCDQVLQVKKHY